MSQADIPLNKHHVDEATEPECPPVLENEPILESSAEQIELTELVQALQERNAFLLERVAQLEVALKDCQTRLQTQNLVAVQDHITRLTYELDSSHQIAQRQQQLIETITNHLRQNQEQVVLLEHECELLKQQHQAQSQALQASENTCADLRSRLYRQQRFTLQLKAALERCLEKLDTQSSKSGSDIRPASEPSGEPTSIQPWLFDESAFSQESPVETLLNQKLEPVELGKPIAVSQTTPVHQPDVPPSLATPPILSETATQEDGSVAETIPMVSPVAIPVLSASGSSQSSQSASPSPLVYPARSSQKKLKSLAAVDLPHFPRKAEA